MANVFTEFDHSALAVNDLELAERFYCGVLGEIVGYSYAAPRRLTTTEQLIRDTAAMARRAKVDADGKVSIPAPRVSLHFQVGEALIPVALVDRHIPEPPPEQMRGRPRLGLRLTAEQMDKAVEVLNRNRVPFDGPVDHAVPSPIARSIYLRDPSSNFLELACERDIR